MHKQWMAMTIAGLMLAGCGGASRTQELPVATADMASSTPNHPTRVNEAVANAVLIDHVAVSRNAEASGAWEVAADLMNNSTLPLPGVEIQVVLTPAVDEGALPDTTLSMISQVRFDSALPSGSVFQWRSRLPFESEQDLGSYIVKVSPLKWLDKSGDGWKPLDPATTEPVTVGKPVIFPAADDVASTSTP